MAKSLLGISSQKELEQYKYALDSAAIVAITDNNGVISYVNDNFCKVTKFSRKELIGKTFTIINSKHHTKHFYTAMWNTILSGKTWHGDIKNKKKNGVFFWVGTTIIPFSDNKGNINQFLSISFDITAVRDASEIKNQFLTNISHELRTPIHGIISTSDFLKETNLDSNQTKFANLIKSSAENLLSMTNNIIDFTSIEAGTMTIEKSDFDIFELVNITSEIFKAKAVEKNLSLNIVIDNNIPVVLNGDQHKLNQILFNLLNNSVKFTIEGGINISLKLLSTKEETLEVEFIVSDTGIGIPEDKKELVFEKFTQLNSQHSREFGGIGLGLSIAKELVELQKGTIKLESYVDFGTTVSFVLTFGLGKEVANEKAKEIKQASPKTDLKVLVVDDSQINHFVADKHLQKLGYKAQFSYDGFDAIEKIEKGDFDLVLMDIQMPVMDGCETIVKIRSELKAPKNKIPIIAVTANALDSEIKRFKKLGANDYLAKPYNSSELKAIIEKILSLHQGGKIKYKTLESKPDDSQKLIDLKWLNDMSGGDKNLIIEMIKLFIDIVPGTLADFKKYAEESNWDGLRSVAHKYATQVSYMGINSIKDDVKNIETYALKQQYIDVIRKLIVKISAVSIQSAEVLATISDDLKKEI
jgi:PAS domain S-box-containing protein